MKLLRPRFRIILTAGATLLTLSLLGAACNRSDSAAQAHASDAQSSAAPKPAALVLHDSSRPLELSVTADGFVPAQAKVQVGKPLTLGVTRTVERTCATEIVIKDYAINQPLPLGQRVEVVFTPTKPGKIRYACGMDMIAGELVAE